MPYLSTTATSKLLKLKKRIRVVAGGTSGGKTISILQILIDYAQTHNGELISVVSESFPHLRRGSMRDFLNIMQDHNYFKDDAWSKTDYTYTFETGSKIEFFSADQPSKVRGPRRDVLFLNEANNVPYEAFDQLRVRTRKIIWIDYNPVSEFWYYTELRDHVEHDFVTLTYKDNEGLPPEIVADIESHKHNKAWWQVYGLGQLGEVEGKIYTGWQLDLEEIPHEARLERRGLDFGYTNDPSAIVDIYSYNGGYIWDELLFQNGMSNRQIADVLLNAPSPQTLVVADSAEPKSIDEISSYGVNIIGANKGPGSVMQGIQYVQDQKISTTKRSTNIIRAYRNYMFKTDKDGKIINVPDHYLSDIMDAGRYGMESMRPSKTVAPVTPGWVQQARSQW